MKMLNRLSIILFLCLTIPAEADLSSCDLHAMSWVSRFDTLPDSQQSRLTGAGSSSNGCIPLFDASERPKKIMEAIDQQVTQKNNTGASSSGGFGTLSEPAGVDDSVNGTSQVEVAEMNFAETVVLQKHRNGTSDVQTSGSSSVSDLAFEEKGGTLIFELGGQVEVTEIEAWVKDNNQGSGGNPAMNVYLYHSRFQREEFNFSGHLVRFCRRTGIRAGSMKKIVCDLHSSNNNASSNDNGANGTFTEYFSWSWNGPVRVLNIAAGASVWSSSTQQKWRDEVGKRPYAESVVVTSTNDDLAVKSLTVRYIRKAGSQ